MKKKLAQKYFRRFLVIWIFSTVSVYSQNPVKNSIKTSKSNVFEQMNRKKEQEPNISTAKLVEFGNDLIGKNGFDFVFAADDNFNIGTQNVESEEFEVYPLKQINGTILNFATDQHGSHPCGTWTSLPVIAFNEKQISLVAAGRIYQVLKPQKMITDKIELVSGNMKKSLGKWFVPLDSMPEAVSKDGKTIYLSTDFAEIYLGVNQAGKLSFESSGNSNLIKKNTDLKIFPKDKNNAYLGYKRFGQGSQTLTVKFSYPCT